MGSAYGVQGVLERLAVDASGPAWLLTGSSRGHLTLWDMRFQLAVNSFQQPQARTLSSIAPCISSTCRACNQPEKRHTDTLYTGHA